MGGATGQACWSIMKAIKTKGWICEYVYSYKMVAQYIRNNNVKIPGGSTVYVTNECSLIMILAHIRCKIKLGKSYQRVWR